MVASTIAAVALFRREARMKFGLAIAAGTIALGLAGTARADCANPAAGFDTAYCAAQGYTDAAQNLNQLYQYLMQMVKPGDRLDLLHEQSNWLALRHSKCDLVENGHTFVDYVCAAAMTRTRIQILLTRMTGKKGKEAAIATGRVFG
jgi:uncharacterized protein YecT (DUF1311 family)